MTPRLAPTGPDDWDAETAALLEATGHLNIFTTLAHHPKLLRRWLVFGTHVLQKSTLPPRERELAILRTGWRCGSEYEFGQHTLVGRHVGLSDDEIARCCDEELDGWAPRDAALLRAVDELVAEHVVSDETWAALVADWGVEQVLDLVFAVGQYTLVSMALRTLAVERDEGVPGFPG